MIFFRARTLPDFRNLGAVLRILIGANVLAAAAAMVRSEQWSGFTALYVQTSALLQPSLLFNLTCLYLLQPWLRRMSYLFGVVVVTVLALIITSALHVALAGPLPQSGGVNLPRVALMTLLMLGMLLGYFDLRSRAMTPAVAEARLQALQARIRPHFLFNALNAVLAMIRTDPRRAETALEDMAELFRVLMRDSRQLTSLADEVSLTMRYLDLEQFRLGDRLRVVWSLADMPGDALVPPLLLQPLVENAVYHGIEPRIEPGEIAVSICRHRDGVEIKIDNPLPEQPKSHAGNKLALGNIQERLHLHFDMEAHMHIEQAEGRYRVIIILPYRAAQ